MLQKLLVAFGATQNVLLVFNFLYSVYLLFWFCTFFYLKILWAYYLNLIVGTLVRSSALIIF